MYAVIRTGGKQYRVAEGDVIEIEKIGGGPGEQISFDEVLVVGTNDDTQFGTPVLDEASVTGTVLNQDRHRKVLVFKMKRRKNYKRFNGHRQYFTRVRIDAIIH